MSSTRRAKSASTRVRPDSGHDTPCTAVAPPLPVDRDDLAYYVRHHLTQAERLVIMLRYAEELEFEEIASVLKVARSEIEEMHRSIVGRLQNAIASSEALAGACSG